MPDDDPKVTQLRSTLKKLGALKERFLVDSDKYAEEWDGRTAKEQLAGERCQNAGLHVHRLISDGTLSLEEFPDFLRGEPVCGDDYCHDVWWLVFLGWYKKQSQTVEMPCVPYTKSLYQQYRDNGIPYHDHDLMMNTPHEFGCRGHGKAICEQSAAAIDAIIKHIKEQYPAAEQPPAPPASAAGDVPNPSVPLSKKRAAELWGGEMTVKKLTGFMESGRIWYREFSRQTFIFSCKDIPNLPPAGSRDS